MACYCGCDKKVKLLYSCHGSSNTEVSQHRVDRVAWEILDKDEVYNG
ncbi:hypothetical protein [Oceanispirochaeta crateris]|nr:hypothetical protein [Oceanispirochaeta crateris]